MFIMFGQLNVLIHCFLKVEPCYIIRNNFSYITTIEENCDEGTRLKFDGGLDKVEDLDKVGSESELSCQ